VQAVESHNRELHARVDRLEMGLREGLSGYTPALPSMQPAALTAASAVATAPPQSQGNDDPVGQAVPR
jgi:hypothetical protein